MKLVDVRRNAGAGGREAADLPSRSLSVKRWIALTAWLVVAAVMLVACGDDGNGGGDEDTLLTGLSGVVIFGALAWFVWRRFRGRR